MKDKEYYESFLEACQKGIYFYKDGAIWKNYQRSNKYTYKKLEEPKLASTSKQKYKRMNHEGKNAYEHRLIFLMHHGIEEMMKHQCIDHINGDKSDNRIENLRGLTVKENTLEAEKIGLYKRNYGEENGCCKIKEKELMQIQQMKEYGFSQYEIANYFGISQGHVSVILNKKKRLFG